MRRGLVALVIVAAATACSNSDSPTSPSSTANQAKFVANLTAAEETPPVTGPESTVRGNAIITFNLGRDAAGTITSANALFEVSLTGIPAGSAINIAHIHTGRLGVLGAVLVSTTLTAGQVVVINGNAQFTKANINVPVDQAQRIIADPPAFYFNVHSTLNPTGVARGQLTPTP